MADRQSDITVHYNNQENQVHFTNQQSQTFSEKDFVQVYNDNLENYEALKDRVEQLENQRSDILEENPEQIQLLNYLLGEDNQEDTPINPGHGSLDEETFSNHEKLMQIKEQLTNLDRQKEQIEEQLDSMKQPAQAIVEQHDDLELEEYDKEE